MSYSLRVVVMEVDNYFADSDRWNMEFPWYELPPEEAAKVLKGETTLEGIEAIYEKK